MEQRDEAPELELSAHAEDIGEDALQVTPGDSVSGLELAAEIGDAFAVQSKPAAAIEKPVALKSASGKKAKQPVQLADEQFVAALLGQPRPESKKAKKQTIKPADQQALAEPAAVVQREPEPVPAPVAASQVMKPEVVIQALAKPTSSIAEIVAPSSVVVDAPPLVADIVAPIPDARVTVVAPRAIKAAAACTAESVEEVLSPERPKAMRLAGPVGPIVATAPVTTLEPEVLPELVHIAAAQSDPAAIDVPVIYEAPSQSIAVISGVDMASVAALPPARGLLAAEPEEEQLLAAQLQPPAVPIPAKVPEIESVPADLGRDFAIPIPAKASPVLPRRVKRDLRIDVKPAGLPPVEPAGPMPATGSWWTLPLMFLGIAMVACALIVPVADDNHRSAYELAKIERDVAHFQQQADVNESFLARVSTDPAMAERLAMRQLNMIRPNEKFAALKERHDPYGMSPFAMVSVEPPPPLPAYHAIGGFLSQWFLSPRGQTYFAGLGVLLTAAGVIFGGGGSRDARAREALAAGVETA